MIPPLLPPRRNQPNTASPNAVTPNFDAVVAAVQAAQTRHMLFPHRQAVPQEVSTGDVAAASLPLTPIVVGVSGGADSVCLLYALYALRQFWRLELHVAHLDHALRPESAADATWVWRLATELGLPFHGGRLAPSALAGQGEGLEDAARRARYAFLCGVARRLMPQGRLSARDAYTESEAESEAESEVNSGDVAAGAASVQATPIVAVAHHLDDQAETVLMNLVRGSGLAGLTGMTPVSELHMSPHAAPTRLVRPLLAIRRAAIHAGLADLQRDWREDSSNLDARFLRNVLRTQVLPLLAAINPQIHTTLARSAELLAGDRARLETLDREALAKRLLQVAPHRSLERLQAVPQAQRMVLGLAGWQAVPQAAQRGILRQALACFDVDRRRLGFEAIDGLVAALTADDCPPGPHPIAGGLCWTYFPALAGRHAMFSLHFESVLPWQPDHPHLWVRAEDDPVILPVSVPGITRVNAAWSLAVHRLSRSELPADWPARVARWEAYVDARRVGEIRLATPVAGMRIAPLGMGGRTKAVGDLFTDAKVHPALRAGWPLMQASAPNADDPTQPPNIVWVCGLALSEQVRVDDATQTVLHLRWQSSSARG